jgi:hypothetical protein
MRGALHRSRETVRHYRLPEDPRRRMEWTLRKMAALARAALLDRRFRFTVGTVVLERAPPRDKVKQAAALLAWARERVQFVDDPVGVEWPQSPRVALQTGFGDCDDLTTLYAAAAMVIGIPVRLVAATQRANDPEWRHVWCEVLIGGRWIPADASHRNAPLGWAVRPQHRRVTLDAFDENAQIAGLWDSIGDAFEGLRDVVVNLATLKYFTKGLGWAWSHMGADMRQLVMTIGPIAAGVYGGPLGKQAADAALALLEGRRLDKKARQAAKRQLEEARTAGILPAAYDPDNPDHLEATWLAANMPADEQAAWLAAHGIAAPAAPASGAKAGGLLAAAAVAALVIL